MPRKNRSRGVFAVFSASHNSHVPQKRKCRYKCPFTGKPPGPLRLKPGPSPNRRRAWGSLKDAALYPTAEDRPAKLRTTLIIPGLPHTHALFNRSESGCLNLLLITHGGNRYTNPLDVRLGKRKDGQPRWTSRSMDRQPGMNLIHACWWR
jgi:hypothetical protein